MERRRAASHAGGAVVTSAVADVIERGTSRAYEVYAVRYGRLASTKADLFYRWGSYGEPDEVVEMAYYFWVLLAGDEAVVVDTGFSTRAVAEMKKLIVGWSKAGVRYVVSSHAHFDHVAGNAIAPSPQAVITAATLGDGSSDLPVTRDPEPLRGRSGRTLPAPYTLRTGGADIKLIPRPGLHSDADVIVYFPGESVVAMGDLLLSESMPAVGDVAGYLAFLDDVLDVFPENTTFISGHGRDLDAAGLRAYRDTLKTMVDVVRTNLAAGRTAEQMVQDDVLKAYKPQYSLLEFLTPDSLIPRVVTALQQGTLK